MPFSLLDDGQLHTLHIGHNTSSQYLKIDEHELISQNWNAKIQEVVNNIQTGNSLYLGGKIQDFEMNQAGLRGCIHQLLFGTQEIDLEKDPIKTANVVPCKE